MSPIRASEKVKYPENWGVISRGIKARALNRCEGTPQFPACRARHGWPHPDTRSLVVLTTAHMDHDVTNNAESNLRALCQRCHLSWDATHHAKTARATRRARKQTGDLFP